MFEDQEPQEAWPGHLLAGAPFVPYAILLLNSLLFKTLRALARRLFATSNQANKRRPSAGARWWAGAKLALDELLCTCELCADCAELNVVLEKHGPLAYALSLFLLLCVWAQAFEEAHTSPAYLVEELLLNSERRASALRNSDTYARFVGQSAALALAGRLARTYWRYELLPEHRILATSATQPAHCQSALNTSTLNGFLVELACCLACRLLELLGQQLVDSGRLGARLVSLASSFACTCLVVFALNLSGGYFNPVLAASLEWSCSGAEWYQHAFVFWLGPFAGHVLARLLHSRYLATAKPSRRQQSDAKTANQANNNTRQLQRTRASTARHKQHQQ